jgi:hypothetical protein
MIHHVSIPAQDPKAAAMALAELMAGRAYPFPGPVSGAFMAVTGDAHGTMIEFYPDNVVLRPGKGDGCVTPLLGARVGDHAFHLLLSVPVDEASVIDIGKRMGWRTQLCARGPADGEPLFHVIEMWVDNRVMIEVATREMVAAYADLIRFDTLDTMFGMRQAA